MSGAARAKEWLDRRRLVKVEDEANLLAAYAAEQTAALQAEIDAWRTGAHADETGHLHRCAKVNGTWKCATGCAKADVAALRAAVRQEHGHKLMQFTHDCRICALLAAPEGT